MNQNSDHKNYYEVLEIPYNARAEDIYHSYQRAKAAYSNDSLALYSLISPDECRNILNLVEEAYTILSDPSKRKMYDEARGLNKNFSQAEYGSSGFNQSNHHSSSYLYNSPGLQTHRTENVPQHQESSGRPNNEVSTSDSLVGANSASATNMTKLVAQQRFALDYVVNADFEKEIEETTEFTGELLKKIREYKNITIERLADMTKVSPMNIRYIESEDFTKLPASVYVRGFVYQYAKCLKLKPEPVANSFTARMKKVKP